VLHFGRSEHFLLPASQIPTRRIAPNLESDYEPLYEPTAVVSSCKEVALRQKVLGKPTKIYLLPRPYLVKEDLTSASVMHMCDGIAGWFGFNKLALNCSFFTPARDTTRLNLKGRFYG
jgi:hypothetical protein